MGSNLSLPRHRGKNGEIKAPLIVLVGVDTPNLQPNSPSTKTKMIIAYLKAYDNDRNKFVFSIYSKHPNPIPHMPCKNAPV